MKNVLMAKIRCICGRIHTVTYAKLTVCPCGAALAVETDKLNHNAPMPVAAIPEGYKLPGKHKKPKIIEIWFKSKSK